MNVIYSGQKDALTIKEVISAALPRIIEADPDTVYLDADLMSCIGTNKWGLTHPRAINVGVAEANMAGVAAGLAVAGFKPYIHSFGCFASRRCFDQVFISAGYAGLHITVLGSDPGVCAAYNGGTHMPFEDVGLYSTIPNATIIDITDAAMLEDILPKAKDMTGVVYIRFNRKYMMQVFAEGSRFDITKAAVLREGTDVAIFATGILVHEALQAAKALDEEGVSAAVINPFCIKPLDRATVTAYARRTGAVVAAENHNINGGLCSAISRALAQEAPTPCAFVAVEDEFGEVGAPDYLQKRFGLTAENVAAKARSVLARKRGGPS